MNKRNLGVAAVFLLGCAVGGASSQLAVPKASAQQAATLTKWEVTCVPTNAGSSEGAAEKAEQAGKRLGLEHWEPVGGGDTVWCWKRPKL